MSAATLILAAGRSRRISKYATFMHHESAYDLSGKHSELKHMVRQMDFEEDQWAAWMSEMTNQPFEFWRNQGRLLDLYLTPEKCLELGVADEIF